MWQLDCYDPGPGGSKRTFQFTLPGMRVAGGCNGIAIRLGFMVH